MSWEITYKELYNMKVEHTFYEDGMSSDLSFQPFPEAVSLLKSHGLLFKVNDHGFSLIYRTDESELDPFIPIEESITLYIGIGMKNTDLAVITDWPTKSDSSDLYFCSGNYANPSLTFSPVSVRHFAFTESYTYTANRVTFRVLDLAGNTLFDQTQDGLQDEDDAAQYHFAFSADLGADFDPQSVVIKTYINGVEEDSLDVFVLDRITHGNIIGVFALELDENIVYDNNLPYQSAIELDASSAIWTYQIDLTRNFTNGVFNINNTGGGGILFNETTTLADYLEGETVVFESSGAITKTELANKDFDLVITSDDKDLTLSGLPNPSPYRANSTIYLKI